MIVRTFNNVALAIDKSQIFVLTDSEEIKEVTDSFKINTILTSGRCLTGSDRVAEAASNFNTNNIYNLQGDEPFFPDDDIRRFIKSTLSIDQNFIGITSLEKKDEIASLSTPKVVISKTSRILYSSRSPIPASKLSYTNSAYRQVCIYKYKKNDLIEFYGPKMKKSKLEEIEDLEILRLIENDIDVFTIELSDKSISIDTPDDLLNLRKID